MNSDTMYRLAALLSECANVLETAAFHAEDSEAHSNRMKTIDKAVRMAERMITIDQMDEKDAARTAASFYCLAIETVTASITMNRKADLNARLQAAEKKRQKGASLRDVSNRFKIPKSTLGDRQRRRLNSPTKTATAARIAPQ